MWDMVLYVGCAEGIVVLHAGCTVWMVPHMGCAVGMVLYVGYGIACTM